MPNRQHTTPTRKETSLVTWIALSVVLVAAGLLRLYKIELQSFSIDESSSLMFSGSPDWRALFWDNNPPLYHIILRAWLTVAPMTEFAVRSLSVVPGILGTYFMYRIGRDTGSASRGWLLAVLFATSGLSIRYAQEARMYSLLEFASVFHLWTLVQYENTQNERTATAFGLSHFLLGLTHLTGLMSGAFGLIHLLRRFPERRRMFVPLAFAAAIVCVVVAGFNIRPENLEWQRSIRSAFGIFYTPADVVFRFGQQAFVPTVLLSVLTIASLFHPVPRFRLMARSLGWSALFFALVGEIASIIDQRNIFIPRYFIALNPYALMMFALGFETLVAKIRDAKLKNLAYGIPVSFCMFFGGAYEYAKPAWRKLASIAAEKEVKLVYTTRSRSIAMPYYYIRGIEVRQFTYSDEFVDELAEALQEKKPIMVLDDLYSRETYLKYLLLDLQNERIITESFEISENRAEPLFGLVLYGIRN